MEVISQCFHFRDDLAPENPNEALQVPLVSKINDNNFKKRRGALKQAKLKPNYVSLIINTKHFELVARSMVFVHIHHMSGWI
jgi:hypothetical protein